MFVVRLKTKQAPEYLIDSIEFSLKILVPYVRDILTKELLHHVDAVLIIRDVVA